MNTSHRVKIKHLYLNQTYSAEIFFFVLEDNMAICEIDVTNNAYINGHVFS